ncbi:dolichol phosphate mannosyltransferas-like protein subunit 3 [Neohortaea acidophila]|uniref:Dolichol-phosphate mannosyltransferase subunit 3 n=1 Tax=Neohortaea acidophila TaxID=245834 RepID=A0A6A6Q7I4_9PEZI|nr:dolichol phosphate mannosyltransferas-like protein subunit 3 [Neohortaea acidophila]KAF2488031.1 dolichol phosphate mannosyltransferas-like protein subunit 3 [Neohortaea acidophila]
MTRAQQHISIAALLSSIYLACFMGFVPFPAKIQQDIIPVLPFWAIVSFGAYLLFKLGYGVLTFNDVPQAHKELMAQIDQARTELKAKGVEVD